MARTRRHGMTRDGAHYAPGTKNPQRGYRHKVGLRRSGSVVHPEWPDMRASQGVRNKIRRAADRSATLDGVGEFIDISTAAMDCEQVHDERGAQWRREPWGDVYWFEWPCGCTAIGSMTGVSSGFSDDPPDSSHAAWRTEAKRQVVAPVDEDGHY